MGSDVREEIRRNHLRTVELVDLVIDLTPKWLALRQTPADVQKNLAQLGIWAQQIRTQRLRVLATWNDGLEKQYAAVGTPITTPFREYVPAKPGFVVNEHPFIVVDSAHELVAGLCNEPDPPKIQAREHTADGRSLVLEPTPKGALLGVTSQFFGACRTVEIAGVRSALEDEFQKVMADLGSTAEEPSVEGDRQTAVQRRFHELVGRARIHGDLKRSDLPGRQSLAMLAVEETPEPRYQQLSEAAMGLLPRGGADKDLTFMLAQDVLHVLATREAVYRDKALKLTDDEDLWWMLAVADWADEHNLDLMKARAALTVGSQSPTGATATRAADARVSVEDAIAGRPDLGLPKTPKATLYRWMGQKARAAALGVDPKGLKGMQMLLVEALKRMLQSGSRQAESVPRRAKGGKSRD